MQGSVFTFRDLGGQPVLRVTFPRGVSVEDTFALIDAVKANPKEIGRLLDDLGRRTAQIAVVEHFGPGRNRRAA